MERSNKSKDIGNTLKSEILNGKFDGSGKLPSEHALMRRFTVARETVRRALKMLQEEKLVDSRHGFGTFLSARGRNRAPLRFGVIVPDAFYPFYSRICAGVAQGARLHGGSILSAALGDESSHARAVRAAEFAEVCVRERVAGVVFQPFQFIRSGARVNHAILSIFDRAKIPVVLIDSDIVQPPERSEYDLVGIDNTNVGYQLARHVISMGAKRIWYFSNPLPAPTSLNRGNGVGIAVTEAGLLWRKDNVFFANPTDTRAAKRLFAGKNRPDAIIAVNDHIASILLKTLTAIGKRVPGDVLLAGVNGDPVAEETSPSITTFVQPCHLIGRTAVSLLLGRIAEPSLPAREVFLSGSLEVRDSTGGNRLSGKKRTRT